MSDLLCFRTPDNIYGIPLKFIKESFAEQKVTKIPRLNPIIKGLCNRNGIIYPVISFSQLSKKSNTNNYSCMLLLEIKKYQLILQIEDIPFIAYKTNLKNDMPYDGGTDLLKIERICQLENDYVYVLNMIKIVDKLYQNILEE